MINTLENVYNKLGKIKISRLDIIVRNQTPEVKKVLKAAGVEFLIEVSEKIDQEFKAKPNKRRRQQMITEAWTREYANNFYNESKPSFNCIAFHNLMLSLEKLGTFLDVPVKLYESIGARNGISGAELKKQLKEDLKVGPPVASYEIFDNELKKEFNSINSRTSKHLLNVAKYNDILINPFNLVEAIESGKTYITISKDFEDSPLQLEYNFLNDIYKMAVSADIIVDHANILDGIFNKEYRYNLTRIKKFILKLKRKIHNLEKEMRDLEYFEKVIKDFKEIKEFPTVEDIKSYNDYLIWEKKRNELGRNRKRNR